MIGVVVVDDDFRVAQVHAEFTEQVPGFRVLGVAHTAAQARELIDTSSPDLVLLDNYLPDADGVALLAELDTDAIVLTAATDPATVRAALAAGALNYLIKPFTAEQLAERLQAYARFHARLPVTGGAVDQEEIDRALRLLREGDRPATPKGRSTLTTQLVRDALRNAPHPRSAAEIADELGISRATAQRYLAALTQDGAATMTLRYGASGRPEHQYEPA
ncbi:response regulator [Saccharopolyspora flava]|uniref:Transcriptional regulatory protein n=1 Tax=Saccharopolyspora flava TaxID=95161 RepID=A0A1I6UCS2_9PSEU|nr:response regulator [Saccharopolyspora flava]SFS99235.1 two-component system, CitB family, response regulator [Saccharopolyspora flava]